MSTSRTRITAIAVAALAAGCGGGGGGDSGGGGYAGPPPPAYVLISAANQDTVARASFASVAPFLNVPVVPVASGAAVRSGLAPLALRALGTPGIKSPPPPAGTARALAQLQATYACQVSGSWTVVWDDRDNNGTMSAGDSVSMSFSKCNDGGGSVVDGGLGMSIASYLATPTTEDITGSMTFQALTTVDASGTYWMNGGVAFQLAAKTDPGGDELFGSYTVTTSSLSVGQQSAIGGLSDTFTYRAGYTASDRDYSSKVVGVPSWEVITASGSFGTQTLGGDLSLATAVPFKSVFTYPTGDIFPTEGAMTATGLNNTRLGVSATTTVQARMDLCDDGDGVWEASKTVSWDWVMR